MTPLLHHTNLLGAKIRAARTRAGLTQAQLAELRGIDRTSVVKWESQNPRQMVSPDRDNLVEIARITRTPLDWFVSDGAPVEPLPELLPDIPDLRPLERRERSISTMGHLTRKFWEATTAKLRVRRSDLWSRQIYDPKVPSYLKPFAPDLLTNRTAVVLLTQPRPYYYMYAQRLANLVAFERASRQNLRLAALLWAPSPFYLEQHLGERSQAPLFHEVFDRLHELADRLEIRLITVTEPDEAAEYLTQIL